MAGAAVTSALALLRSGQVACRQEEAWRAVWRAAGDARAVQAIQQSQPGRHCALVAADPMACRGCPESPWRAMRFDPLPPPDWEELGAAALELTSLADLGLTPADLSPAEVTAARGGREARRLLAAIEEQERAARMMGTGQPESHRVR